MRSLNKRLTIYTLFFIIFLEMFGTFLVYPILPELFIGDKAIFFYDPQYTNVAETAYIISLFSWSLGMFFGGPIIGGASDVYGRKRVILLSLACVFGSYFLSIISILLKNQIIFFLSRFTIGFFGSCYDIAQAYVADISSEEEKNANMSFMTLGISVGIIFGPIVAYLSSLININQTQNVLMPFIFSLIIILTCLICTVFFLKNNNLGKNKKINFVYILKQLILTFNILNKGRVKILAISYFLLNLSFSIFITTLPVFFQKLYGNSTVVTSKMFIFLGLGFLFSNYAGHYNIFKSLNLKQLFCYAGVFSGVLPILFLFTDNDLYNFIFIFLYGFFELTSYTTLIIMLSNIMPSYHLGKAMGGFTSIMCTSFLISSMILATTLSSFIELLILVSSLCFLLSSYIVQKFY